MLVGMPVIVAEVEFDVPLIVGTWRVTTSPVILHSIVPVGDVVHPVSVPV